MGTTLDSGFARRLRRLRERLLPYLKGTVELLEESPRGSEITPEPDSPRPYLPGDDVRAIDWSLYARLDRLFLKTMTREEEVPLLLLPDVSESMRTPEPGKLRCALEVTAALADLYLALGHRVLVVPWAQRARPPLGPYAGEAETAALLRDLGRIEPGGGSDLGRSVREAFPGGAAERAAPVIVSDFLLPLDYLPTIDLLARSGLPLTALQILSPAEEARSLRGNLVLVDPETGREERVGADYQTSRRFREALDGHLRAVEGAFRSRGAAFSRASSTRPFEEIVGAALRAGAARR